MENEQPQNQPKEQPQEDHPREQSPQDVALELQNGQIGSQSTQPGGDK